MKINWHQNPFFTTVEIDERDKHMILRAYQNEEYTELLCDLDMQLQGKYREEKLTDLEIVKEHVSKWGDICNLDIESEEVKRYFSYINYSHMGDCVCVPCSCIRCQVEDMLDINTLKGLGKHSARKIEGAFGKNGSKTIDEAIASLEEVPSYDEYKEYAMHIPRWENERLFAIEWLKKYKEEHGF